MRDRVKSMLSTLDSQDLLLRELVMRELWKPALTSCDLAIKKRERDIEKLKLIKFAIEEGISDENP